MHTLSLCDPEFLASLCVFKLQVPQPPQEMWHMWQGDVLQVTLANQIADSKPDSGIAKASAVARLVSLGPSPGPGRCLSGHVNFVIVCPHL